MCCNGWDKLLENLAHAALLALIHHSVTVFFLFPVFCELTLLQSWVLSFMSTLCILQAIAIDPHTHVSSEKTCVIETFINLAEIYFQLAYEKHIQDIQYHFFIYIQYQLFKIKHQHMHYYLLFSVGQFEMCIQKVLWLVIETYFLLLFKIEPLAHAVFQVCWFHISHEILTAESLHQISELGWILTTVFLFCPSFTHHKPSGALRCTFYTSFSVANIWHWRWYQSMSLYL